ncbi:hypothetical protein CL619_03655 [archaeon]|nr:hypothetical protein [archaeon]|tara:strand:+ start:2296 stop:2802 length:507 start_codon:yes stop_codon:yes gene_type:complete
MNVRKAIVEDSDSIVNLLQATSDTNPITKNIPLDKKFLRSIIGNKGIDLEVFEINKKIVACHLGFDKKIIETTKELKSNPLFAQILKEILYDFTFLYGVFALEDGQKDIHIKMMMMSYLDETKKKTILTIIPDQGLENIKKQLLLFKFHEEKTAEILGSKYSIFELDN